MGVAGEHDSASRKLRHRYDLTLHLVKRDLRLRYRESVLGWFWAVLLPGAQAAVLVFVFQYVLQLGIESYAAFVFAGILPWTWFSNSLAAATGQFLENRDLVRQPGFSPPLLVVVVMISNFFAFLAGLPVLALLMWWFGKPVSAAVAYFPLLVLVEALLIAGAGIFVATLNVFYRDVYYLVSVGTMLLFYLTPVFYEPPASLPAYQFVMLMNPAAGLVESFRSIFLYGSAPPAAAFASCTIVSVALLAASSFLWIRTSSEVFDEL